MDPGVVVVARVYQIGGIGANRIGNVETFLALARVRMLVTNLLLFLLLLSPDAVLGLTPRRVSICLLKWAELLALSSLRLLILLTPKRFFLE